MTKLNLTKSLLCLAFLGVFATSCSDDESNPTPTPEPKSTRYVVAFQENKVGDAKEVDYLLELPSLENLTKGSFDVEGKGITQTGWRFFHKAKNTIFTAGYSEDVTCRSYTINDKNKLAEKAAFTFNATLDCFTNSEDNTKVIAVELHHGGLSKKRFHIIDVATGKLENVVEHEIDIDKGDGTEENPGYIPWISGMVQQGGKLYVAYYKWDAAGTYTTPETVNKAKVAIFSFPEMKFEKIIVDERTTGIGNNGVDTGIVKAENGDMYTYSSSALSAGFTTAPKPSGVLRIKKGTSEFDKDYFFDVENATNGGKVYWMQYIGNGKALARIINDDTNGAFEWGAFLQKDVVRMAILDLNAKTVTSVTGIPNPHGQRYVSGTGILIEDGKIYTGITNETETAVYIIDPITAQATKGAVAKNARSLKGIYKLTK